MAVEEKGDVAERAARMKVLIVDEDEFLAKLFKYRLEKGGFTVMVTSDALTAPELARKIKCGLIITEILFNGADGLDALVKLKESCLDDGSVAIIVLTRQGAEKPAEMAKELGVDAYLVKRHCTPTEVLRAVKNLMSKPRRTFA